MSNNLLNLSPSNDEIAYIENWLHKEWLTRNEGFFCNWHLILQSFEENRLATFCTNDEPLGFITWHDGEIHREIDIMSVHQDYRRKKIGKEFYNRFEIVTRELGFVAMKLFCSPRDSEYFWKKMDFTLFPNRGYSESDLTLFKPLVKINPPVQRKPAYSLELWDKEPHEVKDSKPRWIWDLSKLSFENQILQPCNGDWNVRLTKNGEVIEECKVKYFERDNVVISFPPFLHIKYLG